MNKKGMRILALTLMLLFSLTALTACGGEEAEGQNNVSDYASEDLGFSINMDEELFAVITFDGYKDGNDGVFNCHKWKNTIFAEFDGVSAPLCYVNVYDGEFDEAAVAEKTPNDVYIGTINGFTYTMTYAVDGDGAALKDKKAYNDFMEKYVYGLADSVVPTGEGEALYHEGETAAAQLAWVKSVDGNSITVDPVVMVVEGDTANISKMKAAGVTPDFSQGYMVWNEKEEATTVTLAENAQISLLDESFNFVPSSSSDLASRIKNGDVLISYITQEGKVVEIYEQYVAAPAQ